MSKKKHNNRISRRNFIKGLGGGIAGTTLLSAELIDAAPSEVGAHGSRVRGPDKVSIRLIVNGKKHQIMVEPRSTLLDVLRDHLSHTGTKRVCNRGSCGACTIILNGKTVLACSMFAIDADGAKIETIEGLATGELLHPVQQAFVENDALQCGFCTPGFIMSSVVLLRKKSSPTLDEIKAGVSGNLCRCGTYPNVFKSLADASVKMKKGG